MQWIEDHLIGTLVVVLFAAAALALGVGLSLSDDGQATLKPDPPTGQPKRDRWIPYNTITVQSPYRGMEAVCTDYTNTKRGLPTNTLKPKPGDKFRRECTLIRVTKFKEGS